MMCMLHLDGHLNSGHREVTWLEFSGSSRQRQPIASFESHLPTFFILSFLFSSPWPSGGLRLGTGRRLPCLGMMLVGADDCE